MRRGQFCQPEGQANFPRMFEKIMATSPIRAGKFSGETVYNLWLGSLPSFSP